MIITFWYRIFAFIFIAKLVESYTIYIMNKQGKLEPIKGVIHIDIGDTSATMRQRLTKKLNDFLREPQINREMEIPNTQKRSKNDYMDFRNILNRSPVVYSNGRYTLDLDKIDVQEVKDVTNRPEKDQDYFDPAESFRDYYDYIGISDRLRSVTDKEIPWDQIKNLSKYLRHKENMRKYNRILIGSQSSRSNSPIYSLNLLRKKTTSDKKKRFAIINNNGRKKKHINNNEDYEESYKKKKKHQQNSDYTEMQNDLSESNSGSSSKESNEYDDGVYLQGNTLIHLNGNNNNDDDDDDDSDDEDDRRRRLPHFLPKRYHWDPRDIKKLGYFWFNGPKGKYPYPVTVD